MLLHSGGLWLVTRSGIILNIVDPLMNNNEFYDVRGQAERFTPKPGPIGALCSFRTSGGVFALHFTLRIVLPAFAQSTLIEEDGLRYGSTNCL